MKFPIYCAAAFMMVLLSSLAWGVIGYISSMVADYYVEFILGSIVGWCWGSLMLSIFCFAFIISRGD